MSGDNFARGQNDAKSGRPSTYDDAQATYRGTGQARERFDELTNRHLMVRAETVLKARGEYDPRKYGPEDQYAALTVAEHLELLASGEVLARYYRHPSGVHHAVNAGATWQQIADATGRTTEGAREEYREWADGQHRLWKRYDGRLGMSDSDHAAAVERSAAPDREAGQ